MEASNLILNRKSRWRNLCLAYGFFGSLTALLVSVFIVLFLEGAFATWSFGRFVAGHAGAWLNAVLAVGCMALIAGFACLLGFGKKRILGAVMSLTTIALVVAFLVQNS